MKPQTRAKKIIESLRSQGTEARAAGEKKYLKSDLDFLGVTVPNLRKAAKAICKEDPEMSRVELVELVDALWATRWHEARSVGSHLLETRVDLLTAKDLSWVESLLRRAKSWVYVDLLAIRVVGPLVDRYASCRKRMKTWAKDKDFWIRRSALLADLLLLRRGEGDFEAWTELAVPMLGEKEFFIRKSIGWVLREVSKVKPEWTVKFLEQHAKDASGLTVREAAKRLPESTRARLMKLR